MPTTQAWRTLTEAEFTAAPEAKLRGPLGLIVASASVLLMIAGLALCFMLLAAGFVGTSWTRLVSDLIAIPAEPRMIASRISNWQQLAMFTWAAVFIAMTMMRAPSTPKVASVLMLCWLIFVVSGNVLLRHLTMPNGLDMFTVMQMTPYWLFNIIVVSAFWGYMQDGRAPNIYFKRRVRA
jgi:hypothetical protein